MMDEWVVDGWVVDGLGGGLLGWWVGGRMNGWMVL